MASADLCAHHLQILYFIVEIFARSTNMGTFDRENVDRLIDIVITLLEKVFCVTCVGIGQLLQQASDDCLLIEIESSSE